MEVYNKSPLSCEICKSRLAPQEPWPRVQLRDILWALPWPSRTWREIETWLSARIFCQPLLYNLSICWSRVILDSKADSWLSKDWEQESKHTERWVFMAPCEAPKVRPLLRMNSFSSPPALELSWDHRQKPQICWSALIRMRSGHWQPGQRTSSPQLHARHPSHRLLVKYWLPAPRHILAFTAFSFKTYQRLCIVLTRHIIPICIIVTLR